MEKRAKIRRVPATTENITKGIINYLSRRGHFAFRVNTGGVWDEAKQTFRRTGAKAGTPDIIACLKMIIPLEGWPPSQFQYGQFMGIEVKNKATRDRLSEAQETFADECGEACGKYVVAKGYNEFVTWFESIYGKI